MIETQHNKAHRSAFIVGLFDIFALVALYSLIAVQMPKFADDPGVGWHIATGNWILAHKSIPITDPFLSSPAVRPWVADQWLSDLFLASLYQVGSWPLIYASIASIFLLTFLMILHGGVTKFSGSAIASCVAVLIAFKISQIHFILRPVVLAFLFFTILYVALVRFYQQSGSNRRSFLALVAIVLCLFTLWANCHPSFILGLILLSALFLGLVVDRFLFHSPAANTTVIKQAACLVVIGFIATLINPRGIELHKSIVALANSDFFMNFHMEWRSPDFKNYEGLLFEICILILVLSSFVARKVWRWSGFYLVSVLIFAHFGLRSVRVLPFFSIVASVPLAYSLKSFGQADVWSKLGSLRRLKRAFEFIELREMRSYGGVIIVSLAIIVLIASAFVARTLPLYHGEFGPSAETYSYEAINYLKSQANDSKSVIVAASPDLGGFITFFGDNKLKAVIDDRNTLLGEKFYKSFLDNIRVGGRWRDWLACTEASYLILDNSTSLTRFLKETGALISPYSDGLVSVFAVKNDSRPADCASLVHWSDDKILE